MNTQPYRIKTITQFHRFRELPQPPHPFISVINLESVQHLSPNEPASMVFDFYTIALKKVSNAKLKYGQQEYDADNDVMFFTAPGQVLGVKAAADGKLNQSGWTLLVHPDFLWNTPLAKTIRSYEFFNYWVNEALHLSEKEEAIVTNIMRGIEQEGSSNIDQFSQGVMISQIELLLNYAKRFYNRQFITSHKTNSDLLIKFENLLASYFDDQNDLQSGLPTVEYIAKKMNMSPNYLSDILRTLTGQNAQQHIHEKLIEKAKKALTTTSLSVSEVAYRLGFEHPQSFHKLFKNKTNCTPLEFRRLFD